MKKNKILKFIGLIAVFIMAIGISTTIKPINFKIYWFDCCFHYGHRYFNNNQTSYSTCCIHHCN